MKKSTIFLAIVALIIYGLVLVVSPDISTIMAAVAGIVVAIVFFVILIVRMKSPAIQQRISWLNTVPLFVVFLVVPITFAVILFIQGKLSVILILVMVSLSFSFFYGF